MKNNYSIRPATEDDLQSILKIETGSFPLPWSEDSFRQELTKPFSTFWVITDDQTDSIIIGYIVFWIIFAECQIVTLATDPKFRHLGFAAMILNKLFNTCVKKELKQINLEVRKSNTPAIAMYKKFGFFVDHLKTHFYDDGEDAYFMIRYLTEPPPQKSRAKQTNYQ